MKTLYVTDLDGTLLASNETTSAFTNQTINDLVRRGMLFSYATARSYVTSAKVTRGLDAHIPLIVYNGAFVIDHGTGEILLSNFFDPGIRTLLDDLLAHDVFPIVYAFVDGVEKFSYLDDRCTWGMREFVNSRKGDRRDNPISDAGELYLGDIFYISCIDEEEKLAPFYEKYRDSCHAVYHKDIYSGAQWLELMPLAASKSNAIRQLRAHLGCERLVVFGDGKNDIDMFQLADESYAVANACPELKAIATGVIASNDEDGVAKWLLEHADVTQGD
ncbi:MAG: HAD family hydrolase [Clostridiales bacterium]|nr:HAD family hydrolase [Clostridiales bacterium]